MRSPRPDLARAFDAALLAMLAAACGGRLETSDAPPADGSRTTSDDETREPTVVAPAEPPPLPFDAGTCGDEGARLENRFCASAERQLPCDPDDAGTFAEGKGWLDDDLCRRLCLAEGDPCAHDAGRDPACRISSVGCMRVEKPSGAVLGCYDRCPGGRRPAGFRGGPPLGHDAFGAAFGALAVLETVSIAAFQRLAVDLAHLGAPSSLVDRARAAARDEVRHARAVWALARRYGVRPPRLPRLPAHRPRTTLEVLLENAREGCVREAYGALVAHHQARHAADADVAELAASLAGDEASHAALAWDVHAALAPRLDAAGRAKVTRARRTAVRALRDEIVRAPRAPGLERRAGFPSRDVALAGLDALAAGLGHRRGGRQRSST